MINTPVGTPGAGSTSTSSPISSPIRAGKSFYRLSGELITAAQCFDSAGRLLLLETDCDDATLQQVLQIHHDIQNLRSRLSATTPSSTAAQRHTT